MSRRMLLQLWSSKEKVSLCTSVGSSGPICYLICYVRDHVGNLISWPVSEQFAVMTHYCSGPQTDQLVDFRLSTCRDQGRDPNKFGITSGQVMLLM